MTQEPTKQGDYIVVKDWETAMDLSKRSIPSMRGKYIIVAPHGLRKVSKNDIARLPQVKELIATAIAEGYEEGKKDTEKLLEPMIGREY